MSRYHARRSRLLGAAGVVLLIAAVIALVSGVRAQRHAPQPPPAAASPVAVTPRSPQVHPSSRSATTHGPILTRSSPTRLDVPAIGVHTSLLRIGLTASGLIQTPPLGPDSHAYWLTASPTPGQLGPATIIGHVDSAANGPAVFFRLGALRPRDGIAVTRADGTVAEFTVERVVEYPKAQFPTQAVYGNLDHAGLRLITCGGIFNASQHSYESNIVVYASLVSTHRA
jgi:sortase (surface protein transpeptidase)